MRSKKQHRADAHDESVGPAKLHAGHSRRMLGPGAGAKKGWRNDAEHPLTLAYAKGQLIRGNQKNSAMQRYEAGDAYRAACEASLRKTRDSTDMNVVSGGRREGTNERMLDAFAWLRAVDSGLSEEDRRIVRLVCGEGWFPSEAVRAAFGHDHYKFAVVPRFNEALDHLIEAIAKASSLVGGRRQFGT
jgi:hypothetical protein